MKKFSIFLMVVTLLVSLVGCGGNDTNKELEDSESAYTEEKLDVESAVNNETEGDNIEEELLDDSIKVENGIAYFDMNANEFVESYNDTLTSEAEYIAKSLSNPQYTTSGTGIQQTTIYQYDVSNKAGTSVYTFVHTDENDKILEVTIGIKKQFEKVTVNAADILYNDLGDMAMVLTNFTYDDWKVVADGLSEKILNKDSKLNYFYKGVSADTWSNENALYFRLGCMTEETYNNF